MSATLAGRQAFAFDCTTLILGSGRHEGEQRDNDTENSCISFEIIMRRLIMTKYLNFINTMFEWSGFMLCSTYITISHNNIEPSLICVPKRSMHLFS